MHIPQPSHPHRGSELAPVSHETLPWNQQLAKRLNAPIQPASLACFRIAFGLLNLWATIRFAAYGWIFDLYIQPAYHFTWPGFEWLQPWPGLGMYLHFGMMGLLSLFVALGLFYRVSMCLFFLAFTYVEMLDIATYLNHYYFISILSFLMIFMPLGRVWSLDVLRRPQSRLTELPAWPLWVIRLQLGLVYFFAGVAKLKPDWLLEAQPLQIWLYARSDFPILGPLFAQKLTAYLMSYTGAFFDLTVFFFLLNRRTRIWAWLAVLGFHLLTWALFNIGMFPWIMIGCSLIFFEPDWPFRIGWMKRLFEYISQKLVPQRAIFTLFNPEKVAFESSPINTRLRWPSLQPPLAYLLSFHFVVQLVLPLRYHLYPGNVSWTEQGFRFAWHVMLHEKSGRVDYILKDPDSGRQWHINPRSELSDLQTKAFATQPDMILAYAHHLGARWHGQGYPHIQVYARAKVAWNGRASQDLIDPSVDLMTQSDTLRSKPWILPAPP